MNEQPINNDFFRIKATFFCSTCSTFFQYREELKEHIKSHSLINKGETCYMKYLEGHVCPQCDKTFEVKSDLVLHCSTVCLDAAFTCKHCKENCKHINGLRLHLMNIHNYSAELIFDGRYEKDMTYENDIKYYAWKKCLEYGPLVIDTSEEDPELHNIGDKAYTSMHNIESRYNNKQSFNFLDKSYICDFCHDLFSNKSELNRHIQDHCLDQEKVLRHYMALECRKNGTIFVHNIKDQIKKNERKIKGLKRKTRKMKKADILEVTEKYSGVKKSVTSSSNDFDITSWKEIKLKRRFRRITYSERKVAGTSKIGNEFKFKSIKTISSKSKRVQVENTDSKINTNSGVVAQYSGFPKAVAQLSSKETTSLQKKVQMSRKIQVKNSDGKINNSVDVMGQYSGFPKAVAQLSSNETTSLRKKVEMSRKIQVKNSDDKINTNVDVMGQYSGFPKAVAQLSCKKTTSRRKKVQMTPKIKVKNTDEKTNTNSGVMGQYAGFQKAVAQLSSKKTSSVRKKVQINQKIKLKRDIKKISLSNDQREAGSSRNIIKGSLKKPCKKAAGKKPQHRSVTRKMKENKGFICEICSKKFKDGYKLKRHFFIHSGKRPYTCKQCKKTFARGDHLKQHFFIHSGKRPYNCDKCKKTFARDYHLKRHVKRVCSKIKIKNLSRV